MKHHNKIKLNQTLKDNKLTDLKLFINAIKAGFILFADCIRDYIFYNIQKIYEILTSIIIILLSVILSPLIIIGTIILYIINIKRLN